MIDAYKSMQSEMTSKLREIGFHLTSDEDYKATFSNGSEWTISLEGERYDRRLFGILISNKSEGKEYLLSMVFEIFKENGYLVPSPASFSNELDFLTKYRDELLSTPQPYEQRYDELNKLI